MQKLWDTLNLKNVTPAMTEHLLTTIKHIYSSEKVNCQVHVLYCMLVLMHLVPCIKFELIPIDVGFFKNF